jgi:hypothetical protein
VQDFDGFVEPRAEFVEAEWRPLCATSRNLRATTT